MCGVHMHVVHDNQHCMIQPHDCDRESRTDHVKKQPRLRVSHFGGAREPSRWLLGGCLVGAAHPPARLLLSLVMRKATGIWWWWLLLSDCWPVRGFDFVCCGKSTHGGGRTRHAP
jgi:hypothetical protein